MKKYRLLFILAVLFCYQLQAQIDTIYSNSVNRWHEQRVNELLSAQGWLNLEGLFWLNEGENTFGTDGKNQIVYPINSITAFSGKFLKQNGNVVLYTSLKDSILVDGKYVVQAKVFDEAVPTSAKEMRHGNYVWIIIKREDKIGIRLRNLNSEAVKKFKEIKRFPINQAYRIKAQLISNNHSNIFITNVLGQTSQQNSPGKLVFNIKGEEYALDALKEGNQLFIIFGDATNGISTYASGRFLYTDMPDKDGNVLIDFNKAYNPPCAFTHFATCPLPPKQNRLPIAIEAGELGYANH